MKTTLIATLLCVAGLVLPGAIAEGINVKPEQLADYQARAESGELKAQVVLAQHYLFTLGKEKDPVKGTRWAREAAAQNDAEAQVLLGQCYMNGDGVERDFKEAVRWFYKAAEQNHPRAQYTLGVIYRRGWGVRENYVESYAWLNQLTNGIYGAAQLASSLESQMSPAQLAAGKKRAEELRAQITAKLKSGGK